MKDVAERDLAGWNAACVPNADPAADVRRIVVGAGSSFATGMRVLPQRRRRAIFAVYAFCRVIDDIADGEGDAALKHVRLDAWEDELRLVLSGGAATTTVGRELAAAVAAHGLPAHELRLILEGMRMDADGVVAPSFDELRAYIRRVAGAVGVLSMHVFGCWRGEVSRRFALSLAEGMQLTNILRDVEEDAGLGRLYLPAPLLARAGIPADPSAAFGHPALPQVRAALGRAARERYGEALAAASAHPRRRLLPALMMMGPYERMLRQMEADWSRPPERRPGWLKLADALRCAAAPGRLG